MWMVTGLLDILRAGPLQAAFKLGEKSPALVAVRVAWPLMRTFGLFANELDKAFGISDPKIKAAAGALTIPPFMGSFIRGVAYDNASEMAEGWLAWWAEAWIPGTAGRRLTFDLSGHIQNRDFLGALDIIADQFAELKLEEPLKFLSGVINVYKDIERLTGAEWAFAGASAWLSKLLQDLSSGELVDADAWLEEFKAWWREQEKEIEEEMGRQEEEDRRRRHEEEVERLREAREAQPTIGPAVEVPINDVVPRFVGEGRPGDPGVLAWLAGPGAQFLYRLLFPLAKIILTDLTEQQVEEFSPALAELLKKQIHRFEVTDLRRIIAELKKSPT